LICDNNVNDITKLNDSCFEKYKGVTDIIFAGFPCQGFSTAGKKKLDDPRNSMFLQFLRATRIINPWMIIGENVKGLLKKKIYNDSNKEDKYINIIENEFKNLGYSINYNILKTQEYNLPQDRERLIIIGIKANNPYDWKISFPLPNKSCNNLISIIKYDMLGAVKVNPDWFNEIPSECIITNMNDLKLYNDNNNGHPYLLKKINSSKEEKKYKNKEYDNLFSFGKRKSPIHCEIIDIRKPCKTIICTYDHQPRLFVPIKNSCGCFLRMLTVDELKQIQGFPSDYKICGSKKDQIIQIGNAVPPILVQKVLENIIHFQ